MVLVVCFCGKGSEEAADSEIHVGYALGVRLGSTYYKNPIHIVG